MYLGENASLWSETFYKKSSPAISKVKVVLTDENQRYAQVMKNDA